MQDDAGRILSVRLRHPTEDRELEVRLDGEEFSDVDAVFISVYGVETLLIPFYEQVEKDEAKVAKLRKEVEQRRQNDTVVLAHKRTTSFVVLDIDWNARSPIRL
jgi:hypothetical protein